MQHSFSKVCLITLTFIFATGACNASVQKSDAAAKPTASSQPVKAKAAPLKAVDINSASKAELKTLPGIDDARADKIIAGRPYLSKGFLVTRNIIPAGVYETIKRQIIAKQK
jgi:competence protein ComEA